jgi:hypothetical protein
MFNTTIKNEIEMDVVFKMAVVVDCPQTKWVIANLHPTSMESGTHGHHESYRCHVTIMKQIE